MRIAVVGLAYVGLPLAAEFGKQLEVLGYDIRSERVAELRGGEDHTLEVSPEELVETEGLRFSDDPEALAWANVFIVTTPTPIDEHKRPDLGPVLSASRAIAEVLKPGDVVIYESTVYPGATEEDSVPVLEKISGLRFNQDFFVGSSPERINPGDKEHRVATIVKVTSGSTPEAAEFVDELYRRIITVGTHKAPSIKVAEAAKIIENTQRDVNIVLINELAILFNKLEIDTEEVLKAAGTKWNFLPFRPGLVGGHCIGVAPYCLTPQSSSCRTPPRDHFSGSTLERCDGCIRCLSVSQANVSTRCHGPRREGLYYGSDVQGKYPGPSQQSSRRYSEQIRTVWHGCRRHDPWADPLQAKKSYDIDLVAQPSEGHSEAIVLSVGHRQFLAAGADSILRYGKSDKSVFYDLKYVVDSKFSDLRL